MILTGVAYPGVMRRIALHYVTAVNPMVETAALMKPWSFFHAKATLTICTFPYYTVYS